MVSMFLSTASMGFLQPFVPLYMEASGLDRQQIGFVMGLGTGMAFLIQPLFGRLSDRLDSRRPLMCVAAALAGGAYLSYRMAHGAAAFILLTAIGVNGMSYLNAVGGVLIGRMVIGSSGGGTTYTRYRVWGSVGYIIVALLAGFLLSRGNQGIARLGRTGLDPVFTFGPLLFFGVAAIAWLVPDIKLPRAPREAGSTNSGQIAPMTRNMRAFLAAYFLYQFGLYGASSYLSLLLKSLGASPIMITFTFAVGVLAEVLVMTQVGRWTDRHGRRPALALAFVLMPLRLLCYIPASSPMWVMAVQTLHGLNYGIMGAIAVVFVNDSAEEASRGLAQARLSGVGGLSLAMGPAVCGWLVRRWGMAAMFEVMSLVGAVAAVIFLTSVRESLPGAGGQPAVDRATDV